MWLTNYGRHWRCCVPNSITSTTARRQNPSTGISITCPDWYRSSWPPAARLDWIAVEPGDRADLRGICTTVAAHLAPIALEEKKSIEVTGAESPVIIRGNADALEQAVRNLVENAIRYSARQTVITIDVGNEPSIRVMDRGRGIPSHIKQSMFQRFRRSDRRAGGVGLGLSIVRQSADIHGATVNVEDRPGGGAIFVIRFPKDALMDEPQPVSNPSL